MTKQSPTSAKPVRTDLLAGWARCEFEPPQGVPMPGYIARKTVASGQSGPLYVRALVLQNGKVRVAIIVADVLLISNRWANRLRARFGKILGVPRENMIVAATHTHSGPMVDTEPFDLLQTKLPGTPALPTTMRCVEACMEEALRAAANSMHSVKAEIGRIFVSKVATDRNDPVRVTSQPFYLLRFTARKRRAILGVYGCHSTVLGPDNTLLSGDLLGEISRRLEQDAEVAVVGAGAAANISTRFTRRGQSLAEVRRLASLVHRQIGRASFHPLLATNISVRSARLRLPVRDLRQRQQASMAKTGRLAVVEREGLKVLARLRKSPAFMYGNVSVPFTQVTLGDVSLVALPFEMFSDTGSFFWETTRAVLLGYANGYWGYLPSPAASAGSYEALSSPYDQRADAILRNAVMADRNP